MKFIVYLKPSVGSYIIAKVAKESDKTFTIDQHSDPDFISMEASVKKEHVVWETENYAAATQVRNAILIAHKNRRDTIKLAEDGYKCHITSIMRIIDGKSKGS